MLRRTADLRGTPLSALDGDIGRCKDFLFDDRHWTVRYMVADTGKWIPGRKVLVSPISVGDLSAQDNRVPVELTRKQIEDGPLLEQDAPVSRQHEVAFFQHYGYADYWGGAGAWGAVPTPQLLRAISLGKVAHAQSVEGDPYLRSIEEITGYSINAVDGAIGSVEDFLLDDETWALRYLVVDTRNWLPGRKVLVAPAWVTGFDWSDRSASVDLPTTLIAHSPEYREDVPVDRAYETKLHDSYKRRAYWDDARGV